MGTTDDAIPAIRMCTPSADPSGRSASMVGGLFVESITHLRRVVAGMGFQAADAEDILHDVYVQASERPPDDRSREETLGWLVRVTVNRCRLEFRRRKRFTAAASETARQPRRGSDEGTGAGEGDPDVAEQRQAVRDALLGLDADLLAPMVLCYFCGMDSAQAGRVMSLPAGTVRTRLQRGRLVLARRLMSKGFEP